MTTTFSHSSLRPPLQYNHRHHRRYLRHRLDLHVAMPPRMTLISRTSGVCRRLQPFLVSKITLRLQPRPQDPTTETTRCSIPPSPHPLRIAFPYNAISHSTNPRSSSSIYVYPSVPQLSPSAQKSTTSSNKPSPYPTTPRSKTSKPAPLREVFDPADDPLPPRKITRRPQNGIEVHKLPHPHLKLTATARSAHPRSRRLIVPTHLVSGRAEHRYRASVQRPIGGVYLMTTGYSAGGKTYSLLLPNEDDPPVLEGLL